jgi:hypothetical protein
VTKANRLAAIAATLMILGPAVLVRAAGPAVTSALLPLQGTVGLPGDPCLPAGETVSLAGEVHVVTKASPAAIAEIHMNMAGVDGVGQTSGNNFIGTGSAKLVNLPADPCITIGTAFTLEKTDGCASVPLPVTAGLCFDSNWKLLPQSSSVSIGAPN